MIDDIRLEKIEVVAVPGFEPCDRTFVAAHAAGRVGWYGPVTAAFGRVAESLAGAVNGRPMVDHRGLLEVLGGACQPGDKAASWAAGAIDCAVWDLHGRLSGLPVASLLAPGPVSAVPAYASWLRLDLTQPANLGAVAATAAHPWRFTKWGLRLDGPDPANIGVAGLADLVGRVASHACGKVALDALGTWTPWRAQMLAERVDASTLMWLEDPLPRHNLDQYCELAATGLPIAIGERMLIGDDGARLIELVRPAALTLDVVGCGGLTRAVELVAVARKAGVPVYPHGRSLIPSVHLAAAFPDTVVAVEYQLAWEPVRRSLYAESWLPQFGQLRLPSSPGLGTTPRSR